MAPDANTEKMRDKNKSRINSRQAVRSNPFMSKEAPSGGKSRQQIMVTSNALAARFMLASSWLLCHDAMNLSAPNRTTVYHGTTSSLRDASVQTSPSTPKVRRSVGVEPCRAPNALKSSLKLFCQCCAGWPGPGSSPPSNLPANNSRFGSCSGCFFFISVVLFPISSRWRVF